MAGFHRLRSIPRLILAASLALVAVGGLAAAPDASVSALSRWTGGIDLYRTGVFTTQKTWLWCTAADVQIIRNIVDHQADHSTATQQRAFDYMRAHNRYAIPVTDGVDPAGWTAGLRHFVDSRYRLVASGTFDSALRSAVTNLRRTNLPVAITVSHGNHAWVLTGFTATADPATTTRFTVTSVRVVGPLWGLQSRTYGYDMRPDMKLTPSQLKGFFTPWHYAGVKMAWEGRWVSVQPVAPSISAPRPPASPAPTPRPTTAPAATATDSAAPTDVLAPGSGGSGGPTPAEIAALAAPSAGAPGAASPLGTNPAGAASSTPGSNAAGIDLALVMAVLVAGALAVIGGLALWAMRRR